MFFLSLHVCMHAPVCPACTGVPAMCYHFMWWSLPYTWLELCISRSCWLWQVSCTVSVQRFCLWPPSPCTGIAGAQYSASSFLGIHTQVLTETLCASNCCLQPWGKNGLCRINFFFKIKSMLFHFKIFITM